MHLHSLAIPQPGSALQTPTRGTPNQPCLPPVSPNQWSHRPCRPCRHAHRARRVQAFVGFVHERHELRSLDDHPQGQQTHVTTPIQGQQGWAQARMQAATLVAAAVMALGGSGAAGPAWAAEAVAPVSADLPVYDGVRLIATEKRDQLNQELKEFETRTGWRLRVLTSYGADARPSEQQLKAAWRPDRRTVVINFDPSNPSLTNFIYLGDDVLGKLRRPWWYELQARYGSIFYVRDEGEQTAILNTMSALTECLGAPDGCKVVPGLPSDQYGFTLWLSIGGGIIAGSASRLELSGWVKSRWVWVLIFSPLWGSMFISFGLGPIVSRTSDLTPVLLNCGAFLGAALSPYLLSALLRTPTDNTGGGDSSTPSP